MKSAILLLFLLLLGTCAWADDRDLLAVDSSFVNGDYAQVELLALRLLSSGGELDADQRARVCLTAGYALIMLQREGEARRYFEQALDAVPELTLDPVMVSPKFRTVFDEVKATRSPRVSDVDTTARNSRTMPREPVMGDDALSSRRRTAAGLNLLVPGAGHLLLRQPLRGAVWLAAEGAAVAFLISRVQRTNDARREYLRATESADIESKYQDYDAAYRMSWISGGVVAAVYLASQLDLTLVKQRQLTLAWTQEQNHPALAIRLQW